MFLWLDRYINDGYILYNTETKQFQHVKEKDLGLLNTFKIVTKDQQKGIVVYKENGEYRELLNGYFRLTDKATYMEHKDSAVSTGDLVLDILLSYQKCNSQREWMKLVEYGLSAFSWEQDTSKGLDTLSLRIPPKGEFTWKELDQYEGYLGEYLLVDKLRTHKLYAVPLTEYSYLYPELNREFIEGEYRVDTENKRVCFSDGMSTTLTELLTSVDHTDCFPVESYRTAQVLANEKNVPPFVRLEEGESITGSPAPTYTVVHKNAFIKVQDNREGNPAYFVLEHRGDCNLYLIKNTMTIEELAYVAPKDIRRWDFLLKLAATTSLDKPEPKQGYYTYIGISYIGITSKGYDIRVLVCPRHEMENKKGCNPVFYSIPLICSGLVAEERGEGYMIKLCFHDVVLSKTVYENLVCVGNGEKVLRVKQE